MRCAARASTTSRTSTSISRATSWSSITGLSGSGKSSLAFDTIYAEGQRRYVESLSSYARQFLEQMEKPDVDLIDGLSPAISIEQKTTGSNPRSTVGTVTEIYDYLRLLFANIGVPHCHLCGREITSQSLERIVDMVMLSPQRRAHQRAGADRPRPQGGVQEGAGRRCARAGFTKVRVDGQLRLARRGHQARSTPQPHDRRRRRSADRCKPGIERRLAESVEIALNLADDIVVINTLDGGDRLFSRRLACTWCGVSMPEMTPRAFSFNSPHGACPECQGLGAVYDFDPGAARAGRIAVARRTARSRRGRRGDKKLVREALTTLSKTFGIDLALPFRRLPKKVRDLVFFGAGGAKRAEADGARKKPSKERDAKDPFGAGFEGLIPNLRRRYEEGSWLEQENLEPFRACAPARRAPASVSRRRAARCA